MDSQSPTRKLPEIFLLRSKPTLPPSPGSEGRGLFQDCFHPIPWLPSQLESIVSFPLGTLSFLSLMELL